MTSYCAISLWENPDPLSTTNSTSTTMGLKPGLCNGKPVTICLTWTISQVTVYILKVKYIYLFIYLFIYLSIYFYYLLTQRRHVVVQLFEAPCYKPEGRRFDSRWCHWNFSLTKSFRPHYGPGVDSASNRNEYQEYFLVGESGRCVGLKTLPTSCADCLEICEPQRPGTLRACPGL